MGASACHRLGWLIALTFLGCQETSEAPDSRRAALIGFAACGEHPAGAFCDASERMGIHGQLHVEGESDGGVGSVTSADFDGDGRPDLLVHYDGVVPPSLWLNTASGFVERGAQWGLASFVRVNATAAADLDGDGDPDLLLRARRTEGVQVLRNDRDRFVPVAALGGDVAFATLVPVDLDGDGWLDLTAGAEAQPGQCGLPFIEGCPAGVYAWRQVAPWTFAPVTVVAAPRRVLAMRWYDIDGDERDELLVISDFGMLNGGNQVLRVEGSGSTLALREAPLPQGFGLELFGMGVAPIDVDRDGRDELLVTNFGRNAMLRRAGERWEDVATQLGADAYGFAPESGAPTWNYLDPEHRWMGPLSGFQARYLDAESAFVPSTKWTPLVFDYDQDGIDDVYIGASSVGLDGLFPEPRLQSGAMLRGDGARLVDVTDQVRLGERLGVAHPAAADLDGDGDLDLALPRTAFTDHPGGLAVLRNDAARGRALWIEARGAGPARDGIGARVRVVVGGRTISRRLDGNYSIAGSGPHGVFVGLGARDVVDRVEVRFVSGAVRVAENVPAGALVVRE